ncbi:MAG: hypothetical protein AB7U41_00450 [Dongiaceae bacterium]
MALHFLLEMILLLMQATPADASKEQLLVRNEDSKKLHDNLLKALLKKTNYNWGKVESVYNPHDDSNRPNYQPDIVVKYNNLGKPDINPLPEVQELINEGMRLDKEIGALEFPGGLVITPDLTLDEFVKKYSNIMDDKSTMGMPWIRCGVSGKRYGMYIYFHGQELGNIHLELFRYNREQERKSDFVNYYIKKKELHDNFLRILLQEPEFEWSELQRCYDAKWAKICSYYTDPHGQGSYIKIEYRDFKKEK